MTDLSQLLIAVFQADATAVAQYKDATKNNFPELVKALAAEVANASKPLELRWMAAICLKCTLSDKNSQDQHVKQERWRMVDSASRGAVKDALLMTMRSQDACCARFAGIAASEIACLELPYDKWPQFVPALEQILQAPEMGKHVKCACLECLGFTCERMNEVQNMIPSVPVLPESTVNRMLNAVVQCLQSTSENVRLAALNATNKTLPFVRKNMEDRHDAVDSNLRVSAMAAAAELVTASASDVHNILKELLPDIVTRTERALRMECLSNEDKENKDQILGLLFGLVTALFQKLGKEDVLPHADRVMAAMLEIVQDTNSNCVEEAFLSISPISTNLEKDFEKYLCTLMPPLIEGLVCSFHTQQLFLVCVGAVVDICGAVGNQIQPYCNEIMYALIDCLCDKSVNRETKPVAFSCLGAIAMAIGAAFDPYMEFAFKLMMEAAKALVQPDDQERVDFINRLRLSILDAYTGIIMGLANDNAFHLLVPTVDSVMQFLDILSLPASLTDDMCLQKAVALVRDIAQQMGTAPQIKEQLSRPFVLSLVRDAQASTDESTREIADLTVGALRQIGA